MRYDEYLHLYLLSQTNDKAPYYVVSFDVVDSKKIKNREIFKKNINR